MNSDQGKDKKVIIVTEVGGVDCCGVEVEEVVGRSDLKLTSGFGKVEILLTVSKKVFVIFFSG